ncbi:MAG TPA: helical backbone metal receptor, partial [Cyclobacteriaceae bacterium]
MSKIVDQLGFELDIPIKPLRIVSLVPSQTELLFDLGLDNSIVGVTKFCIHPERAKSKTSVGGTKNFKFDIIESLHPDLIIGNKEENYENGIVLLRKNYPVWMSDIFSLDDALSMIRSIGEITSRQAKSSEIIDVINNEFKTLKPFSSRRCLYLIWKKPWMAAGKNTFIDSMLSKISLINCLDAQRYPELSDRDIVSLSPEVILLSSEPYPFKENHIQELKTLVPTAQVVLVDGELFSWYGSRLVKSPAY